MDARAILVVALILCAVIAPGCQLLSVSEIEIPSATAETTPTDLERVLAAGHWAADANWSLLATTTPLPLADSVAQSAETWRWKFVIPDPPAKSLETTSSDPSDLLELRNRYAWLWDSQPNSNAIHQELRAKVLDELERASRLAGPAGWTAAILLARWQTAPEKSMPLHDKVTLASDGENRVDVKTRAAAVETWCGKLSGLPGNGEENFAPAGKLLEETALPEEVRSELFRGIARVIPPRQIPGLGDVMVQKDAAQLATPLHRAALEACVIHARSRYDQSASQEFETDRWPDGLWTCRFAKETALRKLFGRWAALARHPDALAVLKSQRLDIDLGVREDAVFSLGLLNGETSREELLAVMAKGTDPEREAAIICLSRGGSEEILKFARDGSAQVRAVTARQLGRFPTRPVAVTLADLLRDRSTDVQLAALEACAEPAWKEHGRVSLLLHALRVGALRTQMEALSQLRTEWGLEPIFPLNGTFEERDAAVRKLAQDHEVSAEVFTAFADSSETPKTTEESLNRQTDIRRLVRDFLSQPAKSPVDPASGDELKGLDAAAVPIIEQELERATGPRADFLYRDVLPKLHAGYAALISLESTDVIRRRRAAAELRAIAERASLSSCLLRRLSLRMAAEQDRQVWQDVLAGLLPDAIPEAAQIALVALNSPWPDIRQFACDYFERHPQPEYAAWLLPRLQDPDRQLRLRTIRLLGQCGNPTALDGYQDDEQAFGLRKLLTDSDQQLRWEAVLAMSLLGDAQAAQELIRQSYDPHPRQREVAVTAMGQTGQSRFIEHLLRRSWTENDRAVQAALLRSLDQLVPMSDRPGLAPESSISDKITEWARWWEARQPKLSTTDPAATGTIRPLR
ncbi:MAG TPA: HEAT repeat domain-containing protein [Planctomycetaceae bacterium]|nr:HEAT repeat domain-containing protein [Planctomycetaceae bacterium]